MWSALLGEWSWVSIEPLTSTDSLTTEVSICWAGGKLIFTWSSCSWFYFLFFSNWTCKELVQLLDGIEQFGERDVSS